MRVEELDSDDSSDARGVAANGPARYSAIDIAPKSRKAYAYQSDSSSSSASSTDSDSSGNVSAAQIALRDKEEALVQSALARIRRAQEKGKLEVKLREDELAALENRRKRIAAENAAKAKPKPSSSKRDKASTGGSECRKKKGSGPPMVTVPIVPPPEPASSSSRPHSRRHSRAIHPADPALMESYAAEYRPPSSHSHHQHHASPGRPRSSSSLARPGSQHYAYPPPPMMTGRHASDGVRPGSSASMAGMQMPMTVMRALLPHEEGWDPSASRRGSVGSGVEYDPFEYQVRPGPEGEYGRGGGGGGYPPGGGGGGYPAGGEVVYSNVRRVMPPSSSSGAGGYVERRDGGESSSSEETDEGSGVRVVPERVREREVVPVATPAKKGRKKKR